MKRLFYLLLLLNPCLASAGNERVDQPALEIFYDFEVFRLLPRKWEFENPEDKLFRSNDGRKLYWGPSAEKSFFIIQPGQVVRYVEAPSTGKAYMDCNDTFALWYDRLDQGIFYREQEPYRLKEPLRGRFGVSYDLTYSYVYADRKTNIYEGKPQDPIIGVDGLFVYKIVGLEDEIWLFGFSYLGHEATRRHQVLRYQRIDQTWMEMERFDLPDHLILMDVNPFQRKALFLNEAEIAPQAFEIDLRTRTVHGLGLVEQFAIYLNSDFRKRPEISDNESNLSAKIGQAKQASYGH